jgi:hypothetical protein
MVPGGYVIMYLFWAVENSFDCVAFVIDQDDRWMEPMVDNCGNFL